MDINMTYTVDVLIPVFRPDIKLEKILKSLVKQTVPVQNIILIDSDEASFETFMLGKTYKQTMQNLKISHISQKEFDHGRTRNMGMRMSDADFVLCMTQDAVPASQDLVEKLIRPLLEDESIAVSYARQLPDVDCREMEKFTRAFNYPPQSCVKSQKDTEKLGIKTYFCSNVCAMYRKQTFVELGGFCKRTIFNEDMIYAGKAVQRGYRIAYVAEAEVVHSHNYTALKQFHRNFDLGVSQADHPEIFANLQSESEGKKLVMKTAQHLLKSGHPFQIFPLVIHSGCKLIGYRMGKNYQNLPFWLVKKCSMNKNYWLKDR